MSAEQPQPAPPSNIPAALEPSRLSYLAAVKKLAKDLPHLRCLLSEKSHQLLPKVDILDLLSTSTIPRHSHFDVHEGLVPTRAHPSQNDKNKSLKDYLANTEDLKTRIIIVEDLSLE